MTEFKFSCPHCGQNIACNDNWCGHPLECPSCHKSLIVPKVPGGAPGLPPSAPPPPPVPAAGKLGVSALSQPHAAPAPQAAPQPQAAAKPERSTLALVSLILSLLGISLPAIVCGHMAKARIRRNPLMSGNGLATAGLIIGYVSLALTIAAVVAVVSFAGAFLHSAQQAMQDAQAGGKGKTPGTSMTADAQGPSAQAILQEASKAMQSFSSYTVSGQSVLNVDMSKVDPSSLTAMSGAKSSTAGQKAAQKAMKEQMAKKQHVTTEFEMKLARPDLYRIEWAQEMAVMNQTVTNKGAAWSAGDGFFVMMPTKKYAKLQDLQTAIGAAAGLSGGAAGAAGIFFNGTSNGLTQLQGPSKAADETLDGDDCFVVSGTMAGLKTTLWVAKNSYLIKQEKIDLGGNKMPEMDDAQIEKSLTSMGQKATPEQIAKMREVMKEMKDVAPKMKGSMIMSFQNIETNKPYVKEDFKYTLPAGAKLVPSLLSGTGF